ncbi:capsular polysaccharide biosynthesis protein [Ciceribacter sp. L1K22]|uniref:capsular polysaccharide export protein, LipB/KpsS family n=1 Tax=Ciceribacter sp. L1K22 TaxID=2820275 RepID=UPI001ABDFAE7|nr:capsular polysaccharide biosynthesis protein [Ciceribacter sp. L1K22]MBO3758407.1 capsular polysaccharide biosynthesis protein [Ciceribacter sp. L1K22]
MTTRIKKVPTFAFHVVGWKKDVFASYFPDRKFIYLPLKVDDFAFRKKWVPKINRMPEAEIFVWGQNSPPSLDAFLEATGLPCYFIEDGFLRSFRPNASRTPPLSLALDRQRPYFDSRGPCDLESLLETHEFTQDPNLLKRARQGIDLIVGGGISKYNSVSTRSLNDILGEKDRRRILVLGQVEDDASIRFGCARTCTNNDLVRLAAEENPDAQIIYKPHPDVLNGLREAQSDPADVEDISVVIRENIPLSRSFDTIDKAYTITSLAGFEALMRGIPLTVVGCPFYAGWGLTDDRQPNPRRTRKRSIEEVFAAAYILYPAYFDPHTGQRITFEQAVDWIKVRLEKPDHVDEFEDLQLMWEAWGPYGLMGWRHLLRYIVAPLIGRLGNEKDVKRYNDSPIRFFRELTSPRMRLLGRVLYPFDPPRRRR